LQTQLAVLFERHVSTLAEALVITRGKLPRGYWGELEREIADILTPWLVEVTEAGIEAGAEELGIQARKAVPEVGIAWDLVNRGVLDSVSGHTSDLVRAVTANAQRRLESALQKWIAEGNTFPELVADIRPFVEQLEFVTRKVLNPDYRAKLIAMTEATNAYAQGNIRVWEAAGVDALEWRTAVDDLVCPICGALHRQQVLMGSEFVAVVNGTRTAVARPPAHPGCRCSVKPIVISDD